MNISLTSKLEDYVKSKVDSGFYTSASEVIREALRLLEARENREQLETRLSVLKHDIAKGINSLNDGKRLPLDINQIKAEGRSRRNG